MRPVVFVLAGLVAFAVPPLLANGPQAWAAPDTSPLSLLERRAVQAYETGPFPDLQRRIHEAAGFEVPLAAALSQVGSDALGKQALRAGLKSIVITYDEATAPPSNYENGVTFKDGVLTLNFHPYTNTGDVEPRSAAIRKVLEAGL